MFSNEYSLQYLDNQRLEGNFLGQQLVLNEIPTDKWMHPGLKEVELKRASKALFTQTLWKRQSGSKASQKIDQAPEYVNRVFQETEFARLEHVKKDKQNPASNITRNNFFVVDTDNKKRSTNFFSEEDISIFNMRKPSKKVEQRAHELDDVFVYREGMYLTK